jgi:hypothetical protein
VHVVQKMAVQPAYLLHVAMVLVATKQSITAIALQDTNEHRPMEQLQDCGDRTPMEDLQDPHLPPH